MWGPTSTGGHQPGMLGGAEVPVDGPVRGASRHRLAGVGRIRPAQRVWQDGVVGHEQPVHPDAPADRIDRHRQHRQVPLVMREVVLQVVTGETAHRVPGSVRHVVAETGPRRRGAEAGRRVPQPL